MRGAARECWYWSLGAGAKCWLLAPLLVLVAVAAVLEVWQELELVVMVMVLGAVAGACSGAGAGAGCGAGCGTDRDVYD